MRLTVEVEHMLALRLASTSTSASESTVVPSTTLASDRAPELAPLHWFAPWSEIAASPVPDESFARSCFGKIRSESSCCEKPHFAGSRSGELHCGKPYGVEVGGKLLRSGRMHCAKLRSERLRMLRSGDVRSE